MISAPFRSLATTLHLLHLTPYDCRPMLSPLRSQLSHSYNSSLYQPPCSPSHPCSQGCLTLEATLCSWLSYDCRHRALAAIMLSHPLMLAIHLRLLLSYIRDP